MTSVKPQLATELSLKDTDGEGSHVSDAVAVPVPVGVVSPPHSTVALGGHPMAGGLESVPGAITTGLFVQLLLQEESAVSSTKTVYEFAGRLVNTPFPA
jgi:hypothetical protein